MAWIAMWGAVEWFSGSPLFCFVLYKEDKALRRVYHVSLKVNGQLLCEARMADSASDRVC